MLRSREGQNEPPPSEALRDRPYLRRKCKESCAAADCDSLPKVLDCRKQAPDEMKRYKSDPQIFSPASEVSQSNNETERLSELVAMDCEMVEAGKQPVIARVSIVDAFGKCLCDNYVAPGKKVTDYRTSVSGIRPSDLEKGKSFAVVQKKVIDIIKGKILVGHALKHDLGVLHLEHPSWKIRDTSEYKPFMKSSGNTPSLKQLVRRELKLNIQSGEHDSVEDAYAAMRLYLKHSKKWEESLEMAKLKKKERITL